MEKRRISATVNTDASYSIEHKEGSYAYWIGCEGKRYFGAGMLKGTIADVVEAELRAIANGVAYLINTVNPNDLHLVYINTDNQASVNMIKKKKTQSSKKKYRTELSTIYKLLKGKEIIIRHVPAHTAGNAKRTHTNNKVDEMAKKHLREHLKSKPKHKLNDTRTDKGGNSLHGVAGIST